jgi:para-aminobenzoate synthetase / 4-amino-4-deoxychorismate lyase
MSRARPDPAEGVFETLLLRDGRAPALDAHLARLRRSVDTLYGRSLPPDTAARVAERAAATCGDRRARVDVIPGAGALNIAVTVSDVPTRAPVALTPLPLPGGLGAHKWRDRALIDLNGTGATPLIVDTDETVLEAAWANVWILDGDTLTTPPLDGRLLPGVTRARLLTLAPRLGLTVRQAPITLAQAHDTGTLFLTSALRLAVPAGLPDRPAQERPEIDRIAAALRS